MKFFEKKLLFRKVMKHREKHSSSNFFNFFTYFYHFFNIFDFPNFFTASYRLSRAFMAPRVLAMSNHAFRAPHGFNPFKFYQPAGSVCYAYLTSH